MKNNMIKKFVSYFLVSALIISNMQPVIAGEVDDIIIEQETSADIEVIADEEDMIVFEDEFVETVDTTSEILNEEIVETDICVIEDTITLETQEEKEVMQETFLESEEMVMVEESYMSSNRNDVVQDVVFTSGIVEAVEDSKQLASGAIDEDYTYTVVNGAAIITTCDYDISGDVEIPSILGGYPVKHIGHGAFAGHTNITSIIVPDSVVTIGISAFKGCCNLESITLPFIGGSRTVDIKDEASFSNVFGYIFGYSESYISDGTQQYSSYHYYIPPSLKKVTITDETHIPYSAFQNCVNLTSISISEGVASIGDFAFWNCTNLTDINLPDGITGIGHATFADCTSLTNITLPDSVTTIEWQAFADCEKLVSVNIPNSVTSIGDRAFDNCISLENITISDNVTHIGSFVFDNSAYYNSNDNWDDNVLYIGNHLIAAKEELSGLMNIRKNTKTIAEWALYNCKLLTSVTIPKSVTNIGEYAFYKCNNLENVYYMGMENDKLIISVGNDNTGLVNATWHFESCIGRREHSYKTKYNNQQHYEKCDVCEDESNFGVHSYDNDCDRICNDVCGYERIILHSYKTEYNEEEHYEKCSICGKESSFVTHSYDNVCDATCNDACGYERMITHSYEMKYNDEQHYEKCSICGDEISFENHNYDNVCDILCNDGCGYERTVSHEYEMKYNDEQHYEKCSICEDEINYVNHSYDNACDMTCNDACGYERIVPEHIYDNDWDEDCNVCGFLRSLSLKLTYNSSNLTAVVTDCNENVKEITIPNVVNYKGKEYTIVRIGEGAFENCSLLTAIAIPDLITDIGESAFKNCTNLKTVVIGDNVKNIYQDAFFGCDKLTSIEVGRFNQEFASKDGVLFNKAMSVIYRVPQGKSGEYSIPDSVERVYAYTFYNCDNLTSIVVPDSVAYIEEGSFEGCTSLSKVTMGQNVRSIGWGAFKNCIALSEINFPEGIRKIRERAFENCASLKKVIIPETVEYLGMYVFDGCTALEQIIIPSLDTTYQYDEISYRTSYYIGALFGTESSVEQGDFVPKSLKEIIITSETCIGTSTFSGCDSIESITISNTVTSIGKYAFYGCDALKKLTIPFVGNSINGTKNTHFGYIFGVQTAVPASLKEVVITNATKIDADAFYSIDSITILKITDKLINIGENAFEQFTGLTDVYYSGSKAQADAMVIDSNNECFINATWHYSSCINLTDEHTGGTATCINKAICTGCGQEYGELNAQNHMNDTEIRGYIVENCGNVGYTGDVYCIDCDTKIKDGAVINPTGKHTGGTATCVKKANCSVCGASYGNVDGNAHKVVEDAAKEATCTENGLTEGSHCSVCGEVFVAQKEVQALGHNWGEWIIIKDATITATGISKRTCILCSAVEQKVIDKKVVTSLVKPRSFSVKSVSGKKIKINWSKVTDADGYRVYRKIKGGDWSRIKTIKSPSTISYTDDTPVAGVKYYYKVRAYYKSVSETIWSPYTDSKSAIAKTAAPVLKSVTSTSYNKITIKWETVADATGYRIYRKTEDGSWKKLKTVASSIKSYTDSTVVTGTSYSYTVRASYTSSGEKLWGEYNKNGLTAKTKLNKTSVTLLKSYSSHKNKLKWSAVEGATGYHIYVKIEKNGTYKKLKTTNMLSYTHIKLKKGTKYYYKVRAYRTFSSGARVYSSYSDAKSVICK